MANKTVIVAHGSLKVGPNEFINVGESYSGDEAFIDSLDPTAFVTEEKWLAMQEREELDKQISAMSNEEKAEVIKTVLKKSKKADKAEA